MVAVKAAAIQQYLARNGTYFVASNLKFTITQENHAKIGLLKIIGSLYDK